MAQFMNDTDMSLVRMGAEIVYQSQVIQAQKQKIEELTTELANLTKNKIKEKSNGHLPEGNSTLEAERGREGKSLS